MCVYIYICVTYVGIRYPQIYKYTVYIHVYIHLIYMEGWLIDLFCRDILYHLQVMKSMTAVVKAAVAPSLAY